MRRNPIRRVRAAVSRLRDPEGYDRHSMVGPPEFWREKRQFQLDFTRSQGLEPGHTFVDIGCGTLRGGLLMIDYLEPGNYVGLDVRNEVLEEGRREVERAGLVHKRPELLLSEDFDTLEPGKRFDFAWAFAVLIHMPDEVCVSCILWVSRHLEPAGVFFADVKSGERREGRNTGMGREFPVITRPLAAYEEMAATAGMSVSDLGTIGELGHRTGLRGDQRRMLRFEPRG